MRKAQKQEILDTIQTLHEAHEEIRDYIVKNNYMSAQEILRLCQECAVSIGTTIEKLEGEGFATIPYVEAYCEIVFVCHEELSNGAANANKIYKSLRKQLLRIESSVKNEVPIRKEIAFFPYKASMWDSLESVYLTAKNDKNCDVYCVPIPYYDLNPDHSFGQMHYEGREYPKNIEVIDWQTYSFEERKPDVIYIHNPYDECNLVTSVHPRFYSSNLKKYTEELVYIPYFILREIEPDDQKSIDSMKHFIWTPGVVNADKVIVQSEQMKQIYVNEYLKAARASGMRGHHIDRKYLEQKILGLGSPKIEKVLNTKKEDLDIPEEWLKVIQRPDGSWKKIVFYNTGISALLQYNEKWVEKIEDVLRIFKENQEEVALLWRPHPLIENTMKSMRPDILQKYLQIKSQYLKEGWGIYDDTADMDRAVALSDAYYGDNSSVAELCEKSSRPVLYQHITTAEEVIKDYSFESDICIPVNNELWCSGKYRNIYYTFNLTTGEICIKGRFRNEDEKETLYYCANLVNNEIFWIPYTASEIAVYDLNTNRMNKYALPLDIQEKYKHKGKFGLTVVWNDCIYAFGYEIPVILKIICADKRIEYIDISGLIDQEKDKYLFKGVHILEGNSVYLPFQTSNKVLEFDLNTEKAKCHKLNFDHRSKMYHDGFTEIVSHRENYILYNWNDERIEWQPEKGIISVKNNNVMKHVKYKAYKNIICTSQKLIAFPWFTNSIYVWDDKFNFCKEICMEQNEKSIKQRDNSSRFGFIDYSGQLAHALKCVQRMGTAV